MGAAVQAATTKIYHQKQERSNKYSQKSLKNIAYKELLLCNCRWSRFTFVLTGGKKKSEKGDFYTCF